MRSGAHWLAALRRRQRTVLCALWPAFALSALSGPACAAMNPVTTRVTTEVHGHAEGHAAHHHTAAHADEPAMPATTPCPHCPLDSGAANGGHASCTVVDGQDGGIAQPISPAEPTPQPFIQNWLLPAAGAAPPLIVAVTHSRTSPGGRVSLTLRHCVLLI